MKILVTGAAGFIGSHTCERLVEMGHKVVGIDNFSTYYNIYLKQLNARELEKKGITVTNTDLRTSDLSIFITEDIDYIFHFAAQPGISVNSSFEDYFSNNFVGTQRMLDVIETLDKKPFFVNISTSSVYGLEATFPESVPPQPASWYGVTKLAAEQLVLAYVRRELLMGTSLRLYSVYGPRERPDKLYTRLIACALTNKPFPLFKGSKKHLRSFTYVQDIVDGIVSVIGKETICNNEIFNLGTEVENTTARGIEIVEDILQRKISITEKPARPGDQSRTRAAIEKARNLLDYHPSTPLDEGLEVQVKWYQDNFGKKELSEF